MSFAQAPSRGTVAIYPVIFDDTGTETSRDTTKKAIYEVMQKAGFKPIEERKASAGWTNLDFAEPTMAKPPTAKQLARFGADLGAKYVVTATVHFHTRSIWVNLGPKTISTCDVTVTIIDPKTGKIAYEKQASGRSDEKSDPLKVAGAVLISPLVTAVSGGPKTPQESRAGQIAAANALYKFVVPK